MDEQETTTEEEQNESVESNDNRSEPESHALIDKANTAAERLEEANKKQEELINRQEELAAHQRLGGELGAGKQQKKELTPKEYKDMIMSGVVPDMVK